MVLLAKEKSLQFKLLKLFSVIPCHMLTDLRIVDGDECFNHLCQVQY